MSPPSIVPLVPPKPRRAPILARLALHERNHRALLADVERLGDIEAAAALVEGLAAMLRAAKALEKGGGT